MNQSRITRGLTVILLGWHGAVWGQDPEPRPPPSPEGRWHGTYATPQFSGEVQLLVVRDGAWAIDVRATSPYVTEPRFQRASDVSLRGDSVSFAVDWGSSVRWTGTFSGDSAGGRLLADHWTGTWEATRTRAPRGIARPGDIVVANLESSEVAWFDGGSGAYCGPFVASELGGLQGATGIAFGPDGGLFVGSAQNHQVLRYDGETGAFDRAFVSGGQLESPFSLIFGPDGHLYVSSGTLNRVLRYDGRTGDFVGVAAEGDGLQQPIGLAFGPHDGLLYVVNSVQRTVLRFDPTTGVSHGVFAADSLAFPSDLAFGPDGDLYVSNAASSSVVRFDGGTGAFIETLVRLPGQGGVPMGLAFRDDGTLVVGDFGRNRLYLVDAMGETRLLADEGMGRPENIAIKPAPERRAGMPADTGSEGAGVGTCMRGEAGAP